MHKSFADLARQLQTKQVRLCFLCACAGAGGLSKTKAASLPVICGASRHEVEVLRVIRTIDYGASNCRELERHTSRRAVSWHLLA